MAKRKDPNLILEVLAVCILLALVLVFVILPLQTVINVNLNFTHNSWNATLNYSKVSLYQYYLGTPTNITNGNTGFTIQFLNSTNGTVFSLNGSVVPYTYLINTNHPAVPDGPS